MILRKSIIIAISLLFNTSVFGQTDTPILKCSDFQNGKYEMFVDTFKIEIERHDGFQIEKSYIGETKYEITWDSDCEYTLKLIETNIKNSEPNIGREYKVKIVDIKDNTYKYECEIMGFNYIIKGEISKIIK